MDAREVLQHWAALVVAVPALLAGASEAGADVRPLAAANVASGPVLTGTDVAWTERRGPDMVLRAAPAAGGPVRTLARLRGSRRRPPVGFGLDGGADGRVALATGRLAPRTFPPDGITVLAGPVGGGAFGVAGRWRPADGIGRFPFEVTLTSTGVATLGPRAVVSFDPGAEPRVLRLGDPADAALAGDAVAVGLRPAGVDPEGSADRVVVRDRVTGEQRLEVPVPDRVEDFGVQADGRVAIQASQPPDGDAPTALLTASPADPAVRRLGESTSFMGDVFVGGDRVVIARALADTAGVLEAYDLAGGTRRVGYPTRDELLPDIDGDRVAWSANGCVLVADLSSPDPPGLPAGPCARAEVEVASGQNVRARGGRVRVAVRCLSAPAPGCRGRVVLRRGSRSIGRGPIAVAAGARGVVSVRLNRVGRRIARRRGDPAIDAVATVVDPEGRRSRHLTGVGLGLRGA